MLNMALVAPLIAEMSLEVLLDGPVTHIALEERMILLYLRNMSQLKKKKKHTMLPTRASLSVS